MSKLLIVESPGKIKKIQEYLGNDFIVMASVGHIMDLDPYKMSINLDNFEPEYVEYDNKKDIIKKLKSQAKKVGYENILLASDEDREGEMIAWSLANILKINNKNNNRIVFNSITSKELNNAINNPKKIDFNMVYAQQARRILDRLAGFLISPLLNKNGYKGARSAGRVQSVVVKIIVDKEKEIEEFYKNDKSTYFYINCNMNINEYEVLTKLVERKTDIDLSDVNDKNDFESITDSDKSTKKNKSKKINTDNSNINKSYATFLKTNEDKVLKIIKYMTKSKYKLLNIVDKIKKSNPPPPFTTSTLQQYASRIHMNGSRTMSVAQKLYEAGHITYMRTDSTSISEEAVKLIKDAITNKVGIEYFEKKSYVNKKANTQEAHECIRPTKPNVYDINGSSDEKRLYNIIWKRTLQSQMKAAEYQNILIEILMENKKKSLDDYKLVGTLENLIYEGYLILDNKKGNKKLDSKSLKDLKWININGIEDTKKPPTRYNEASLINKMDPKNLNIGRPSTYASFIEKIISRRYVEIKDIEGSKLNVNKYSVKNDEKLEIIVEKKDLVIGNEKQKFVPTYLGKNITNFLEDNFSKLMDYKFTANMEKELDDVAEGNTSKYKVIDKFYKYINDSIENIKPNNYSDEIIIGKYNDNDIILKNGPYSKYFSAGNNNISLKQILNNNNTTEDKIISNNELLLELILKELESPNKKTVIKPLKEWNSGKTKYLMKNGQYGHYIEELKNNSKKNYTMNYLINKKANDNNLSIESINEILDLITVEEIKESISVVKSMKKKK